MSAANDNPEVIQWCHIELSAGTITASTIETSEGVRALPNLVGKFRFFIDAVCADGDRFNLHICPDYEDAIRLGEEARTALEIDFPVKDTVAGSH